MIQKIHHISSIVSHAQQDLDFYASFLGMRLVKQTLNYDDFNMFHLYYGNRNASENIWTTFPMLTAPSGRLGGGQVARSYFQVQPDSLDFWEERFRAFKYDFSRSKQGICFQDPVGLKICLVEGKDSSEENWSFNGVEESMAFQKILGVDIYSQDIEKTRLFLEKFLGFQFEEHAGFYRSILPSGEFLRFDKENHGRGHIAVGSVHHLALGVADIQTLETYEQKLEQAGYETSGIKNRHYFHSLYVREPGGLLIELATEGPGMLVDENIETLGKSLKIPPHAQQKDVENMMPLFVKEIDQFQTYSYRDRYEFELLKKKQAIKEQIVKKREEDASEEEVALLKEAYRKMR